MATPRYDATIWQEIVSRETSCCFIRSVKNERKEKKRKGKERKVTKEQGFGSSARIDGRCCVKSSGLS